jgi:EAL domain-containing protein (putative c-di-GMP-specific phosphodiesterase class I)/GGDEF domain-containing protein
MGLLATLLLALVFGLGIAVGKGSLRQVWASLRSGDAALIRPTHMALVKVREFEALRAELGSAASDKVMRTLAGRLDTALTGSRVGRIGRTTIEVSFCADQANAVTDQLQRARAALERSVVIDGLELSFGISCGAAPLIEGRLDNAALDRAASALAEAHARHEFVAVSGSGEPKTDTIGDLEIARHLGDAINCGTLELHYQPKLNCRENAVRSVEALLRWTHAELGAMPIERVVNIAERTGAIRSLTDWVVGRAVADSAKLAEGGHDVVIFINLSGRLLADHAYIASLVERIRPGLGRIGFEITETAVIDDPADAIANVTAMSVAGIKIAIDDYGSGLSSLAYLKMLPASELKIDQMFIRDLVESHRDPLLVRSSIDLAHALEMEVTAEGVDNPMTLSLLRVMGCDIVQGYLISRPLSLEALVAFLDDAQSLHGLGQTTHALPAWTAEQVATKQA